MKKGNKESQERENENTVGEHFRQRREKTVNLDDQSFYGSLPQRKSADHGWDGNVGVQYYFGFRGACKIAKGEKRMVLSFCFCQHCCWGISKELNVFRLVPLQPEVLLHIHWPKEGRVRFQNHKYFRGLIPAQHSLRRDKVKFRSQVPKTRALTESKTYMFRLQVLIFLKVVPISGKAM